MRHQLSFERVFTHNCVQWFRPVNNITNKHILEEIFKEMTYGNENEVRTAYFAAMDIIRSSSGVRLLGFLRNGGLIALRNLINSCHLRNRGQAPFAMALDIFEGLLSVDTEVRVYLLRYWDMILRPVKKWFTYCQRIHGFANPKGELSPRRKRNELPELYKHFHRLWLEEGNNSQRVLSTNDVGLFSEYLRTLEIMVHTAPDSTPAFLKKVFLANKRLDPFHKTIKDLYLNIPPKKADLVFGPRVDFGHQECWDAPFEIVSHLKKWFDLEEKTLNRVGKAERLNKKISFKPEAENCETFKIATTCFDTIKGIALESPPKAEPKVSQLKYCQQLDDTNRLAAAHTLSHTTPSIVALINKNPLLFPSVRKLIDPTGNLEDTALKIMKFKPPKILHKHSEESPSDQKMAEKLNINLRISDINSVYGVELGKIFDMCLPRIPSSAATRAADELIASSEREVEEDCNQDSSKVRMLQDPESVLSGDVVPRDTLDMSIVNSVESYSGYLNRASIQTVDDLARVIVRKALFGILEKPMPDIEGEVSKLCQDFCENNGYSRYSLDRLAEAIVDKVLSCLINPNACLSSDQTVEDEIKHAIHQCLCNEQEEHKRSKLPRLKSPQVGEKAVTRSSERTQTLPLLCFRKTIQAADKEKVSRELKLQSVEGEKTKVSVSIKGGVISQPGTRIALEEHQDTETRQNDGGVQLHRKSPLLIKEPHGRQSLEGGEINAQKPVFPALNEVPKLTTSIPHEDNKGRRTFQLCMQNDQVVLDENKGRVKKTSSKTEPPPYQLLNQVFTNVAEQLSAQLEAIWNACPSAGSEEDEINKQALYVVQRVIFNLALQMSAASAGACKPSEESGTVKRQAISIARQVLSYSGIPPAFRSSDLGVKNRATYIVNRIVLGALKELSKSHNNSNQNAFAEKEDDDDPIPIVWRPREVSLARAVRTGRLAT